MVRVVIVGAGPAGIAAAEQLSQAPVEVTLVDEGGRPGGQLFRSPAPGLQLNMRNLLGQGHAAYKSFHETASALCSKIDYRPRTLVWSIHGGAAHLASSTVAEAVSYDALILATGAIDRIMPVPGWTLPGVFTLGGAQALMKDQGCLIGRRVVFCGSSPLLFLAACQYLAIGGEIAAVIDTTAFSAKLRAIPDMIAAPSVLAAGLRYMAELKRRGVQIIHGATLDNFEGEGRLSAVRYHLPGAAPVRIPCDGAAYGHGLRPEAQLAEIAGLTLRYDQTSRLHLPDIDTDGRAGKGIYLAGDGARIGGGEAAAISGAIAAAALLHDLGMPVLNLDLATSRRRLARLYRFQKGLATAFRWPREAASLLDDSTTLCRCENINVGEVRVAMRAPLAAPDSNRIKAVTRCGMGRCQGRFCGSALAELTASISGRESFDLDHLRAQAPVKPIPIALAEQLPT